MRALMRGWTAAERRAAQKVVDFLECECVHIEGDRAGERFLLEQWQEEIVRKAFGRLRADGTRRYRTVYIEIPRKNGKTTLCAALALYLLAEDNEPGAQIYSAGIQKSQGAICHDAARTMVEMNPRLQAKILPFRQYLETAPGLLPGKPGKYSVLSADDSPGKKKLHGFNVSGAVLDEWHTQPKGSKVWEIIKTGTGSRRQPMILVITTSGDDLDTPCGEMHKKARAILDGEIKDDSFLAVIFAADSKKLAEDPGYWRTEEAWREANPNLGVSVKLDYLREQADEAERSPAYLNTFLQLHLNVWTNQAVCWMPMDLWDRCAMPPIDSNLLKGFMACSGLDLGSARDLTAHVLVFPRKLPLPGLSDATEWVDGYDVVAHFFMPRERLKERMRVDRQPYDQWAREGWLTLTDGDIIDYEAIEKHIIDEWEFYELRDLSYDRDLTHMLTEILKKKIGEESDKPKSKQLRLWPFGQGFRSMSGPTKDLLELVRGGRIRHGGNPILRWMFSCVTVDTDPAGNVKMVKPSVLAAGKRIDGCVALVMGLHRAMLSRSGNGRQTSKYNRGERLATTRDDDALAA